MNPRDQYSIVRISRRGGPVFGGGVLISKRYILTCASVVTKALLLRETPSEPPNTQEILVDFPLISPKKGLRVTVLFWTASLHDIAVLELLSEDHQGIPARLRITHNDPYGHHYHAYGCPPDREEDGQWNNGVIIASTGKYVQLQSKDVTGIPIFDGFIGTPVWDDEEQAMVGIIAKFFSDPSAKTSSMISLLRLRAIWPELEKYIEQPEAIVTATGPTIVLKPNDVDQVWGKGKKVQIGKASYIVYSSEEDPSEPKNRTWVRRIVKARLASGTDPREFFIKQVAFFNSAVVAVKRGLLREIREEYKLLRELNDNREPGFSSAIYLDDGDGESAAFVFKANAGKMLADTYGFTTINPATGTLEGKAVSSQRARQLLQGTRFLCTMLAALHHQKCAHRNLSLETILYASDNRIGPRLILRDLGLAARERVSGEGHPDYAAPEQRRALDLQDIGSPTDIYQVGAILYHLLSGHPPEKNDQILAPSIYNPDLPYELDDILLQALADDCRQRWPNIEAFGTALFRIAEHWDTSM